jgi:hypothetical protein
MIGNLGNDVYKYLFPSKNPELSITYGPTWIRTRDPPVMSRELYQLSYGPNPLCAKQYSLGK